MDAILNFTMHFVIIKTLKWCFSKVFSITKSVHRVRFLQHAKGRIKLTVNVLSGQEEFHTWRQHSSWIQLYSLKHCIKWLGSLSLLLVIRLNGQDKTQRGIKPSNIFLLGDKCVYAETSTGSFQDFNLSNYVVKADLRIYVV